MHSPIGLLLLAALLAVAVYSDLRRHRIPNALTGLGVIAGLGLQAVGGGLHGLTSGLLGVGVGLACFAPFYLLRAMGAGDVKLLAVVGAFLGPQGCFYAALASLLAGGLGAISYVLWRGARAFMTFVREGFAAASAAAFSSARIARRDRLPFALPIAVGGIVVGWHLAGSTEITAWLRGASH
jgi:prepilin peptidase CpaA